MGEGRKIINYERGATKQKNNDMNTPLYVVSDE